MEITKASSIQVKWLASMQRLVLRKNRRVPAIELSGSELARSPWFVVAGSMLLALCAAVLWALSLQNVDLSRMTDVGLASILPITFFIALVILTASFCLVLRQDRPIGSMLLLHIVFLIFMLYSVGIFVEELPRFAGTWKHIGVADYIVRTGQIDPRIDAYFNWPGFFVLVAFLTQMGGVPNALSFAGWSPVVLNLLYLGPLLMLFSSATRSKRLIWLGVWFFYLTNWIGQDYFSPQGLNYFLYLVILAILLKWFKVATPASSSAQIRWQGLGIFTGPANKVYGWLMSTERPNSPAGPAERAGLLAVTILLFMAVVPSHQLTPFFTLANVAALVVCQRCSLRTLPILMVVLITTWIMFMAVTYLGGHITALTSNIGEVDSAVGANVTGRMRGSPGHVFVVYLRLVMTVAIWGLAFLGGIRRLRNGYRDWSYALLAVTPFPLLILQPYGGEMLLRVYLFVLPPMAFFAAGFFFPTRTAGASWWTTLAIGVVSTGLIGGFLFTRYGNERMDYFTRQELEGVRRLYEIAEPNSLLLAGTANLPWKLQDYEQHKHRILPHLLEPADLESADMGVGAVAHIMRDQHFPAAYLIITRSTKASVDLLGDLPHGSLERLEQALTASPQFKVLYANEHAKIFALAERVHGAGQ